MKKSRRLAGCIFALLSAGPALAADLPSTKAPPIYAPPPPAFTWTGFYLDAGAGYGEWNANNSNPGITNQVDGGRGFFGRAGGGFDYQFTDHLVAGVFGDGTYGEQNGIFQDQLRDLAGNSDQNWSWAAGARLGWLLTPDLFAYGDAGFTQAHFSGSALYSWFDGAFSGSALPSFTANGWFAGAGFETMFAPGWFWRTEYRFADYGGRTLAETGTGPLDLVHVHPITQTITSGLVYKFGWPEFGAPGFPSLTTVTDGFGPPPTATEWTGLYADAGIGYGLWSANSAVLDPLTNTCIVCVTTRDGGRGIFGTVGVGYDYQLTNKIVAGVFGDFDPSDLRGTIIDEPNGGLVGSLSQNWAWAAGARLGWLVSPSVLTYTQAGFTQARFGGAGLINSIEDSPSGVYTSGFTSNGWFLGGGAEAEFAPGWFWRAAYRYAEYGSRELPELGPGGNLAIHFRPEEQTATFGLVYKFNWAPPPAPAPVVAKY